MLETSHLNFFIEKFGPKEHKCKFFLYKVQNCMLIGDQIFPDRTKNLAKERYIILENQRLEVAKSGKDKEEVVTDVIMCQN